MLNMKMYTNTFKLFFSIISIIVFGSLTSAKGETITADSDDTILLTIPEYDLDDDKLCCALVRLAAERNEKYRKSIFLEFYNEDESKFCKVIMDDYYKGLPMKFTKSITGYGYVYGKLVFINNRNKTPLRLKKPPTKKEFRFSPLKIRLFSWDSEEFTLTYEIKGSYLILRNDHWDFKEIYERPR